MRKISLLAMVLILFSGCSYIPNTMKGNGTIATSKCNNKSCNMPPVIVVNPPANVVSSIKPAIPKNAPILRKNTVMRVSVVGQGVAPTNTSSPAQAYALAKRAAIAEGYRLLAEKIKGVYVEGQDLVKNMMVKRTSVRTAVSATIKNANTVETTFKDGLCEVDMEVAISYSEFL